MTERGNPKVESVLAAARRGRKGGRSPLYEWFWAHYDTVAPALLPPHTPNWGAMAEEFVVLGIMDGKGQPPKAITVRQTFAKVRRNRDTSGSQSTKSGNSEPVRRHSVVPAQTAVDHDDIRTPLKRRWET